MIARSDGGAPRRAKLGRGFACCACLLAATALELGACGDNAAPGGGGNGGSSASATFADSECGVCLTDACADAIGGCLTDAGCASYLDCLLACPVNALGNADSDCDEACIGNESSETTEARIHLKGCREIGPGADCPTCNFSTDEGPEPQVCEDRVAPNPCRQCFWDKCCDTWDACFDGDNPDCDTLTTCIAGCETEVLSAPCIDGCFGAHPASVQTFVDQALCAAANCANEQKEDGVPTCDAGQRNECEACWYETCGPQLQALMASPSGYLTWICTAGDCGDVQAGPECYEACTEDYPEAKEAFLLWGECVGYSCSTCQP